MGGTIGVETGLGRGSTFHFTIPLARALGESKTLTLPPSVRAELRGKRVLVVDDNATNRKILQHYLQSWGMRLSQADTAPCALELLHGAAAEGDEFALLLTDLQMPEMDGLALARAVRADPVLAPTPILLLSSLGDRRHAVAAKEAGIEACLMKPIRKSHLRRFVASILSGQSKETEALTASEAREAKDNPRAQARGRILVAEDNAVNQKLAVRLLEKLGFSTDVVANGLEAVDAFLRIPYDAILMDCLMPECDGFEATLRIRQAEGSSKHTLIIALTANAMQGDREKCLAAGMDDYLAKPFKLSELDELLRKNGVGEKASRLT
jgi:CheY-like chemotaxis protein